MNKRFTFLLVLLAPCTFCTPMGAKTATKTNDVQPVPLAFMENKGQITDQDLKPRNDIRYKLSAGSGLNIFIGSGAIHYQFARRINQSANAVPVAANTPEGDAPAETAMYSMARMDVELVGANKNAHVVAEQATDYSENYFTAFAGPRGATAHSFNRITFKDIYPRIDWVLYSANGTLKHEFLVRQGGRVSDIRLKYGGADLLKISTEGALIASTALGTITEKAPYTYQQDGAQINSIFRLNGDVLSYETGNYTGTLTIDPTLAWSTYYGGTGDDEGYGLTTDASGNLFMTGFTSGVAGIATTGAYQTIYGGGPHDAFLVKFNTSGVRQWATYYGGTGDDEAQSVAADASGNIFVCGYTASTSGIATAGSYQPAFSGGGWDGFLVKFDATGNRIWATYYGGAGEDRALSVATDPSGNVLVAGYTSSSSGIATLAGFQPALAGTTNAFLVKFSNTGVRLWGTYYGGSATDFGASVSVDVSGNIYLSGSASSLSGIASPGAYQTTNGGGSSDAFLAKFDSTGVRQWGTYYGGSSFDKGFQTAVDGSGNTYLVGYTGSLTGISSSGAYQSSFGGGVSDAFLVKFNSAGARQWGTYLGGSSDDEGSNAIIGASGDIFCSGSTGSSSGIATPSSFQPAYGGGAHDGFIAEFTPAGGLAMATYFGGPGDDAIQGIQKDASGNLAACGWTGSTSAIATTGASQTVYGGGMEDAFLAKFAPCSVAPVSGPSNVCLGGTITMTDATPGGTWTSSNTAIANIGSASGALVPVSNGVTTIVYTTASGCSASTTVTVGVAPAAISGPATICFGSDIVLTDPTPGGFWISSNTSIITIGSASGLATAVGYGHSTISYIVGGCSTTVDELVNLLVDSIESSATNFCPGSGTTVVDPIGPGSWTSSNPGIATVGTAISNTSVVTGVSGGIVTITFTIAPGCFTTSHLTVNAAPAAIAGASHVCLGSNTTLTDATPGGFWTSTNNTIATITGGGFVTSVSGGLDTIVYTLPTTGCSTRLGFTVIDLPALSGHDSLCAWGDTTTISDSYPGGIFTSSLVTVLNLGGGAGRIIASAPTVGSVTYTIPAGCTVSKNITVNPLPAQISGSFHVCTGVSTTLDDGTTGGTWSCDSSSVLTINPATGVITGVSLGTAHVFYTLPTGCKVDTVINVTAPPSGIAGPDSFCVGNVILYTDSISGGIWGSSNPSLATINPATGMITGYAAGTVTVTYLIGGTCLSTKPVTVNPLPAVYVITGGGSYCAGGTGLHIGLSGSQAGVSYQLYNGLTPADTPFHGTGGPVDFGLQAGAGTYSASATNVVTGCTSYMTGSALITALPLPVTYSVTGGGSYCAGGTGLHIGLAGSGSGINYQLLFSGTPSGGPIAGTGAAIDFGAHTAAGIYTVKAINILTSCTDTMPGGVSIVNAVPVVPSVSITSAQGDTVCAGTTVGFTAVPVNGGIAPLYQWRVNGANVGTGSATYIYTPANNDQVGVVLTSSAFCALPDTAVNHLTMTVEAALTPTLTVTASPGSTILIGQSVTFTATAANAGPAPAYQWSVNGLIIAGATNATYTSATLSNSDVVTCAVTSTGPCGGHTDISSITMTVNSRVGVGNLFSGIEVKVQPNPNNGTFLVTGMVAAGQNETIDIDITDMLGQVAYRGKGTITNGKINENISLGDRITNGMYLLTLRSTGEAKVFHVVISR